MATLLAEGELPTLTQKAEEIMKVMAGYDDKEMKKILNIAKQLI